MMTRPKKTGALIPAYNALTVKALSVRGKELGSQPHISPPSETHVTENVRVSVVLSVVVYGCGNSSIGVQRCLIASVTST